MHAIYPAKHNEVKRGQGANEVEKGNTGSFTWNAGLTFQVIFTFSLSRWKYYLNSSQAQYPQDGRPHGIFMKVSTEVIVTEESSWSPKEQMCVMLLSTSWAWVLGSSKLVLGIALLLFFFF